jgi:hypothetical protein
MTPSDKSLGNKNLLGIVVDMDKMTLEIQSPNAPVETTTGPCSFSKLKGQPLSIGVRVEREPSRQRRHFYGVHDFTIRESKDEAEWNRLFAI